MPYRETIYGHVTCMSCRRQRLPYLSATGIWISLETNTALELNVRFMFWLFWDEALSLFFSYFSQFHHKTRKRKKMKAQQHLHLLEHFFTASQAVVYNMKDTEIAYLHFFVLIYEMLPSKELFGKRALYCCYTSAFNVKCNRKHPWGRGSTLCSCSLSTVVPKWFQHGK